MPPTPPRISSDIGDLEATIAPLLASIYQDRSDEVRARILSLADDYADRLWGRGTRRPTHATTYLIIYGDAIRRPGETPLHTLGEVLDKHVADVVSDVHLLPMFPWTSDDGFAVVDYRQVNPALGTWDNIAALAADHALMFDFVANHASSSSPLFVRWLAGDPAYDGFFLERDPEFDVSRVIRPRTSPLFHTYRRPDGTSASVWTTFGPDQVDVNLATPAALVELTDVLLGYLERGASAVRLDAIGFLWKESGTTCLHLPQTHAIIKLWRAVIDHVAPGTQLLTETNVPHAENVAYFGNGHDEANLVYQFALPPLVLHAFVSGRTTELSAWASGIGTVSPTATWFNFLASHDGIGLRATEGLLSDDDRQALIDRTLAHGGRVSMAARADGNPSVYELNINYLDALAAPEELRSDTVVAQKALAAHSILVSFLGVPAIYYHSLFGSRSDLAGMAESGINRRINRQVLDADRLAAELQDDPRRRAVFAGIGRLLKVRGQHAAFSPYGSQQVENYDRRTFVVRRAAGTHDEIVCATNVTSDHVTLPALTGVDVISGEEFRPLVLQPYGFAWLRRRSGVAGGPSLAAH
jgi:glycosidase